MAYRFYSSLPRGMENKNLARIDTKALAANYRTLYQKAESLGARAIAVIKADAYGHGIPICVPALLRAGCDFFAVASLAEAIAVRTTVKKEDSRADILIFGYTDPSNAALLIEHDLIQSVYSEEYGLQLARAAEDLQVRLRVHLAVDTGMNRVGFEAYSDPFVEASVRAIKRLSEHRSLLIQGLYSHLACADTPSDPHTDRATKLQIDRFEALSKRFSEEHIPIPMRHLCNSAGLFAYPEAAYDAVRMGIALYGVDPLCAKSSALRPVMRLESHIVHLHTLIPGESLGYGGDFSADTPRLIATVSIGYADGFLRSYSGASVALYTKTKRYDVPVVGRVCMDQCMLDVTDTDAALGDRVILFGDSPFDVSRLADHANTIPYEILTSVSARVERVEDK